MSRKSKKDKKTSRKQKDILEKQMEDFREEIKNLGKRRDWDSWFHRTFGLTGPLISAIFSLIIFVLIIRIIDFVNFSVGGNRFLFNIYTFLMQNTGLFFLLFLFFSYIGYFSKVHSKVYKLISPIVMAVNVLILLWIITSSIAITNFILEIPIIFHTIFLVNTNLVLVLLFLIISGYLILLVKRSYENSIKENFLENYKYNPKKICRLYRSGKDKILGGVCGGIAEYLGVDPVIIRLLWIIATFLWGFSILFYIIAWIIIPRNPNHKWD